MNTDENNLSATTFEEIIPPSELNIGTELIDKIALGSNEFTIKDTFCYSLLYNKTFNAATITMRFYKKDLINGGHQILLSKDVAMSPNSTALYQKLPAENMIHEFGVGVYELEFLLKDSFIAKQSFILK